MWIRNQMDISEYNHKHFRPSCLPSLNLRFASWDLFGPNYEKPHDQIQIPTEWNRTPEDTVLNYFSLLREAENMGGRSCGSIGQAKIPFPIAYNFLSKEFKRKVSYEEYLHSFAGIGHTSLIKLCRVPDGNRGIKFFYEIETIEGIEGQRKEYFGYSYGFIQLVHEKAGYRISNLTQVDEDFLCAPYHGWSHWGEDVADVKYGNWCKLVKKRYHTIKKDYVKNIYFDGNDGANYCLIFFTLTNGTDIEIAQFRKKGIEQWKQIFMKPEKDCIN